MCALSVRSEGGVGFLTDTELRRDHGIVVAFSKRGGGRSRAPYESLNLAAHVGDEPGTVDANRSALMSALGLGRLRDRLTMCEQVHGTSVRAVSGASIGMGAFAREGGPPPIPATDALLTTEESAPLLLCFADCVPVVLVAPGTERGVAVVHAGWRGALHGIVAEAVTRLAAATGARTSEMLAYVGPHIGACHYEVGPDLLARFVDAFGAVVDVDGRLDLGAAVSRGLTEAGVPSASVSWADACTFESTGSFFSHRAEGVTGRHGALACVLGMD
jgi:YfiH family protein